MNFSNFYIKLIYITISSIFISLIAIFSINYVNTEKDNNAIYYWDSGGEYNQYIAIKEYYKNSSLIDIKNKIIKSIGKDDYNILGATLLYPFRIIFGESRVSYILSVLLVYFIPTYLIYLNYINNLNKYLPKNKLYFFTAHLSLIPQFLAAILRGFLAIESLFFLYAILSLTINPKNEKFTKYLCIGMLLAFSFIFKRFYIYWSLSYILTIPLYLILKYRNRDNTLSYKTVVVLKNIILILIGLVISLLIISPNIIKRFIFYNYSYQYSAYNRGFNLIQIYNDWISFFGVMFLIISTYGLFAGLANRKSRIIIMFLFVQLIFTITLFNFTQSMASHHLYLIFPAISSFIFVALTDIFNKIRKNRIKVFILFIFFIHYFTTFIYLYLPLNSKLPALPSWKILPLKYNDIRNLDKIITTLGYFSPNCENIYLVASSESINSSILKVRVNQLKLNNYLQILETNDVDKRDGFPNLFFEAKTIITTYPVQYHLNPEDQRVIGILDNYLNSRISEKFYFKLPVCYSLDGVEVFIFIRTKEVDEDTKENLKNQFYSYYPDFESKQKSGLFNKYFK